MFQILLLSIPKNEFDIRQFIEHKFRKRKICECFLDIKILQYIVQSFEKYGLKYSDLNNHLLNQPQSF